MADTNQRKVSVKLSLNDTPDFTMNILPGNETSLPGLNTHPVLTMMTKTNSEGATQAKQWMEQLIARNQDFITWLESSPENSILFIKDPVAAIHKALPDLPQSFYDQLTAASSTVAVK
ncbi:hypothetical protein [Dyadobacter sp. NIV53]|uniref:hypothetical protein n=1 Tax=Dyadobacter sp. NIV53 TaxID=2861765 RepID=UPI001C87392F|nr:hypothetical protein [Dyadobacter sp. NIV53]